MYSMPRFRKYRPLHFVDARSSGVVELNDTYMENEPPHPPPSNEPTVSTGLHLVQPIESFLLCVAWGKPETGLIG